MARGKSWGDDSTTQIKFAAGGSLTLVFKGNLFDLTPEERQLITDLSITVQRFQRSTEPDLMVKVNQP